LKLKKQGLWIVVVDELDCFTGNQSFESRENKPVAVLRWYFSKIYGHFGGDAIHDRSHQAIKGVA
jgi:hypothetical protein